MMWTDLDKIEKSCRVDIQAHLSNLVLVGYSVLPFCQFYDLTYQLTIYLGDRSDERSYNSTFSYIGPTFFIKTPKTPF